MDVGLQGQEITGEEFGFTVSLQTSEGFEVQIETAFSLCTAGGRVDVSPGDAADADRLQALVRQTVTSSIAENSGALSLAFANGVSLHVEPDEDYEAWTIAGPRGQKVVCGPGGEISSWSADGEAKPRSTDWGSGLVREPKAR